MFIRIANIAAIYTSRRGMNTDDLHESFFVIELNVMDRAIGAAAVLLNATRGI